MPSSIEKDYYIWRFLSQGTTTSDEAKSIIQHASRLNSKLEEAFRRKTGFTPKLYKKNTYPTPQQQQSKTKYSSSTYFRAGINALEQKNLQKAIQHFGWAQKVAVKELDRDQANFWLYLTTQEKVFLDKLLKSKNPNFYTLIAQDLVGGRYPDTITENLPHRSIDFDVKDPIDWVKIKYQLFNPRQNLNDLAKRYNSQDTIGPYTYIKAYASGYTEHYYPMPYRDAMSKLSINRQALIYAIARQESRFVSASVSTSYALGMMQIMPFLVKHIAKEKGENIDLDAMFDPYKAIEYADYHLDYLTKYLYHPLFIAYAYNGGIGFTRNLIRSNHFKKGAFEPYLSIEKMDNIETREYGKKVLVNYVIYRNKLGQPTRLLPLIKLLSTPEKTDKFRN
jgi:soluble lytic murein transglycosylase